MIKEFLEIGQIVSTHGIKGEVRLNPWCDSPEFVKKFKTLYRDEKGNNSFKIASFTIKNIQSIAFFHTKHFNSMKRFLFWKR